MANSIVSQSLHVLVSRGQTLSSIAQRLLRNGGRKGVWATPDYARTRMLVNPIEDTLYQQHGFLRTLPVSINSRVQACAVLITCYNLQLK